MSKKSKITRPLIAAAYVLVIMIGLEFGLRILGYTPFTLPSPTQARFIKSDTLKGWAQIPGYYEFAINNWGDTMNLTINEEGERITNTNTIQRNEEEILLIGGSFIMGMGLDDNQTLGWKLQQQFTSIDVRNLGVGAYGTYQSLLVLKEQLKQETKPKAIIYGLIGHHRLRNVAQSDWLTTINLNAERSGIKISLPYVTLGANDTLIPGDPIELSRIPFSDKLTTIFMIERAINRISGYQRTRMADKILGLLILEIQQLCKANNIRFYVGLLNGEAPLLLQLTSFFEKNGIHYIDCIVPLDESNTFRDDRHPKAVVNEDWAKRISERLLQDGIVSAEVVDIR